MIGRRSPHVGTTTKGDCGRRERGEDFCEKRLFERFLSVFIGWTLKEVLQETFLDEAVFEQ